MATLIKITRSRFASFCIRIDGMKSRAPVSNAGRTIMLNADLSRVHKHRVWTIGAAACGGRYSDDCAGRGVDAHPNDSSIVRQQDHPTC